MLLPSLSFKGLTHEYFAKTTMTYDKYLTFLFLEDNDLIYINLIINMLPKYCL